MAQKVAVLMGGDSSERNISLMSGNAVLISLRENGINAYPIDTKHVSILDIKKQNFDKAFITLHGRGGEDGFLQAILEFLKISYTGSGILASALTIDKIRTKLLWKGYGLPTSNFVWLNRNNIGKKIDEKIKMIIKSLGFPVVVKPNTEGSSIGISKSNNVSDLYLAIEKAFSYDDNILIENFLSGPEYTVGILGTEVLPPIRIEPENEFYDYNSKYIAKNTNYFCPSDLDKEHEQEIKNLAISAWNILGCHGCGRIDIMMDNHKKFQLLEVNTCPGMTNKSLIPMAAKQFGLSFSQLVLKILEMDN